MPYRSGSEGYGGRWASGGYHPLGGAATPAFTPASVEGLVLWLDASDESTITDAEGAVSQWNDKSGEANHATQGSSARMPATGAATFNSLNAMRFDQDFVSTPLDHLFNVLRGFVVYQRTGSHSNVVNNLTVVVGGTSSSGIGGRYNLYFNDAGTAPGSFGLQCRVGSTGSTTSTTIVRDDNLNIHEFYGDASVLKYRLNGGTEESTAVDTRNANAGNVRIGADSAGTTYLLRADVGEILLYNQEPSTADLTSIREYLATKWGITLA